MAYNVVADSIHTKKLRSRLWSAILHGNRPFCVFESLFRKLRVNARCSS